jgi:hypothetical protein
MLMGIRLTDDANPLLTIDQMTNHAIFLSEFSTEITHSGPTNLTGVGLGLIKMNEPNIATPFPSTDPIVFLLRDSLRRDFD